MSRDGLELSYATVGFTFHKFFPGYGWFKGEVIQIRPDAAENKTRRVLYSDGDSEDISVEDIKRCIRSYDRSNGLQRLQAGGKKKWGKRKGKSNGKGSKRGVVKKNAKVNATATKASTQETHSSENEVKPKPNSLPPNSPRIRIALKRKRGLEVKTNAVVSTKEENDDLRRSFQNRKIRRMDDFSMTDVQAKTQNDAEQNKKEARKSEDRKSVV